MPTYRKYRYILTALLILVTPPFLPYVIEFNPRNNAEIFGILWLWIVGLLISIFLTVRSFKTHTAKVISIIIGVLDVMLICWILFGMLIASSI